MANIRGAECFSVKVPDGSEEKTGDGVDPYTGGVFCAVYGLEELPLSRLEVLEGEIDPEKLKTGKYILEGVELNDDETPNWAFSHYEVGDKVTLYYSRGTKETRRENELCTQEFEVMAKVKAKYYTSTCRVGYDYQFYLPAEVYKGMVAVPGVMSYVFNVSDGEEEAMDAFLKNYTDTVDPVMNYSSKLTSAAEFEGTRNMILLVGGALSFIIGVIGILNFINSMLTSIITRRREFAMLRSIGMTGKQLLQMLIVEGLYYAGIASVSSLLLGMLFSLLIVRSLAGNMWFFSYRFTILPILLVIPVLFLTGAVLPALVQLSMKKQSIVERLREAEA